ETTLRQLAADEAVAARCRDRSALFRLWDACQTPDFRKTTQEDHVRLVSALFGYLTEASGRVPADWMAGQFHLLDRTDGEIDALSTRLAGVRTLAYVANRPEWLADPAHWQGVTRALEDRLSDTLHEKLMARFIDRRTSALMRGLGQSGELLAGVDHEGAVTVEGHYVGKLRGVAFDIARGGGALEDKALRAAAQRAVGPEVARRLGRLAGEDNDAFAVTPEGEVLWRGEAAGMLANDRPFAPAVRLYGELGPEPARTRAARRLEAFVAAEAGVRLPALRRLEEAIAGGAVKGLPRGLAYRLLEAGGVLDRRTVEADLKSLSQAERRALRSLGVRIGAFSVCLPSLLSDRARPFAAAFARQAAPDWRPSDGVTRLPSPAAPARALGLRGLVAVGPMAVSVEALERFDELLRGAAKQGAGVLFSDQAREELGWSEEEARLILRGLGFVVVGKPKAGEPVAWRRAAAPKTSAIRSPRPAHASPFAALAALRPAPTRARRARRKPRRDHG
ncbi:MAG TPA: phosphonate-binding protein, partial [Caulobacteraceae bacterium]|nr:phosphonate-binding protein [Caulobacteraceae bacterium]